MAYLCSRDTGYAEEVRRADVERLEDVGRGVGVDDGDLKGKAEGDVPASRGGRLLGLTLLMEWVEVQIQT